MARNFLSDGVIDGPDGLLVWGHQSSVQTRRRFDLLPVETTLAPVTEYSQSHQHYRGVCQSSLVCLPDVGSSRALVTQLFLDRFGYWQSLVDDGPPVAEVGIWVQSYVNHAHRHRGRCLCFDLIEGDGSLCWIMY